MVISQSETKGLYDIIKPHSYPGGNGRIENMRILNQTKNKSFSVHLIVNVEANTTLWNFLLEISYMLDLAP